jgi:hypothetical protein
MYKKTKAKSTLKTWTENLLKKNYFKNIVSKISNGQSNISTQYQRHIQLKQDKIMLKIQRKETPKMGLKMMLINCVINDQKSTLKIIQNRWL